MIYQRESFAAVRDEVMPLLEKHWAEVAHYKDIPLDVDLDLYEEIERAGILRIYTARINSPGMAGHKQLIGYLAAMVRTNGHYKRSLQATQDVLFVDPAWRGCGGELIRHAEEELRLEGVQVLYQHVKAASTAGRLMEHIGYELVDLLYAKRLDR